MRIAALYLLQESNTFSAEPTRLDAFRPVKGQVILDRWGGTNTEIAGFAEAVCAAGHKLVPVVGGWAMTSGRVVAEEFGRMGELVEDGLSAAGKVDGYLVALHGAMSADDADDADGAILEIVRRVGGAEVPIIVTLDLHANVTARMMRSATAILGYKTYPHVDMGDLGRSAAALLLRTLAGEVRPVAAWRKIPMILPAENMQTAAGPMAEVFATGERYRRDHPSILDVSAFGVQPWLDVEEMGCSVVVVADGDNAAAGECVRRMAERFWELRKEFRIPLFSPADAIQTALATPGGPVVIAESADSPTGGASGDSAEMVRALLERGAGASAAVCVRDARVAALAWELRPGAKISTALGGTVDRAFHRPLQVEGVVRSTSDGRYRYKGSWNRGVEVDVGRTAVIDIGPVSVVVSEQPASGIDPEIYRSQGIEPRDRKIVVVKSATAFREEYGPFAARILVADTPGVTSPQLASLPYRRVPRPIYPLDEAEFMG